MFKESFSDSFLSFTSNGVDRKVSVLVTKKPIAYLVVRDVTI